MSAEQEVLKRPATPLGWFTFLWGAGGVVAIFVSAVVRLLPWAVEAWDGPLETFHLVSFGLSIAFMGYTEGYKAFQKQYSPRVIARALRLADAPRGLRLVLAPLFCMGFFGSTRKRLITSWVVTVCVIGLIVAVKMMPQPWRGIVDAGVVVGLSWGALAMVYFARVALTEGVLPVSSDIAEDVAR